MKYYCNPINVPYRYQFNMDPRSHGKLQIDREAADPSMILFQGKYYIFASMNLSVWVSEDMVNWESYRLPDNLPLYDYAPDARVCGDYVYFCASKKGENCNYYRTKDIINGPYEEIPGTFDFWDPNLFFDEDGSVYFYWGCSNITSVWGVELDPVTMVPKTERIDLLSGNAYERGYERMGVDHCEFPKSEEEVEMMFQEFVAVLLVTNTWNIVMGVFDITQSVVNDSAGVIISDTSIDIATVITDIEAKLDAMSVGGLLGLWFQSLFVGLTMKALSICIMLVVYGRMIEIYLVTSIAPIPVATMVNREWGGMGQNYLKSLLALGFQAFLILVCVGIYAVLIQTIAATDDISGAIWSCMGYTVLLCFTLFKTGSLAKSVFSAH